MIIYNIILRKRCLLEGLNLILLVKTVKESQLHVMIKHITSNYNKVKDKRHKRSARVHCRYTVLGGYGVST